MIAPVAAPIPAPWPVGVSQDVSGSATAASKLIDRVETGKRVGFTA